MGWVRWEVRRVNGGIFTRERTRRLPHARAFAVSACVFQRAIPGYPIRGRKAGFGAIGAGAPWTRAEGHAW